MYQSPGLESTVGTLTANKDMFRISSGNLSQSPMIREFEKRNYKRSRTDCGYSRR